MQKQDLEHLIRAVAAVTNHYDIVVIGSQAVLASVPNPPLELTASIEADMYPRDDPGGADLIDGSIGEGSPFHKRFGYYAEGVGPETAILPQGWRGRLVKLQSPNTDLKIGWCLELHDLAASKLAAQREKDWPYVRVMLAADLVDPGTLISRIEAIDDCRVSDEKRKFLINWVRGWVTQTSRAKEGDSSLPRFRS